MEDDDLPLDGDAGAIDAPEIEETQTDDTAVNDTYTPRTVEDIAQKMGWSPREQWRGDPDKWKPADQFVEHTAEINTTLANKLKSVDARLENISRTNQAMTERLLAEQREKLMAERQEAFDVGDAAKFNQLDQQLQTLPTAAAQPAPEVQAFTEKHAAWFNKDQEATTWAFNRAEELSKKGFGPARQVAIVERELAQYFPEYAPQEKPKAKAVALTQPGNRAATSRGKSFNDLPSEAQKEAIFFESKGVTRDQYVASYFQSQEA